MFSRTIAAGFLVAGCVTAAAAGGYLAGRQNGAAPAPTGALADPVTPEPALANPANGPQPVSETESIIGAPAVAVPVEEPRPEAARSPAPRPAVLAARREDTPQRRTVAGSRGPARAPAEAPVAAAPPELPAPEPVTPAAPKPLRLPDPPSAPPEPQFEELIIPSSSVIGLRVETPVSSERASVEDRVDARVTRDVLSAGRVAIPAGSRVIGAVTMVERGGKVKERARLGVRFHTVVLADGSQAPLATEAILREGERPSGESARKIGGAAVGGAILGAIMGGKKGAVIGGATGAGAGTAAVMAGDRNAATLPAGTIVTVRLSAPASIEVERR